MAGEEQSGRATIKDVYEISGRVEKKVDDLSNLLSQYTISNEHRFTELETNRRDDERRLTVVEGDVSVLKTEHATAKGHVKALAWVAGTIGTVFAGVGGVGLVHTLHW